MTTNYKGERSHIARPLISDCQKKMKFGIICDSAADLPEKTAKENQIQIVPFYVSLDGKEYKKEGTEIAPLQLYQGMADHPDYFPKTSTPTIPDYAEAFYSVIKQGLPVLCICLTQKFSSSYQAALSAKELVQSELPEAKIFVMDSQLATGLEGVLVTEAARLRDQDWEIEDAVKHLEELRGTGHIFFTTKDLKYLHNGGRLSSTAYIAGSMLDIKPLLHCHEGDLTMDGVCRGQKKSLHKIADKFVSYLTQNHIDLRGYVFGTGVGLGCPEYDDFLETLQKKMDENDLHPDKWIKIQIGATIGVHTGPYPVGLGFVKRAL